MFVNCLKHPFPPCDYNLTIHDETVVFARSDRADPYQVIHSIIKISLFIFMLNCYLIFVLFLNFSTGGKKKAYCEHLKDDQGSPAFAIVNVATGKALQHGILQSYGYPVCGPRMLYLKNTYSKYKKYHKQINNIEWRGVGQYCKNFELFLVQQDCMLSLPHETSSLLFT